MRADAATASLPAAPQMATRSSGSRNIRVLHVLPSLAMGGAERMVLDLFRTVAKDRGFDLRLCVLADRQPAFYDGFEALSPVFCGYSLRYRDVIGTASCVRKLK